MMLETMGKPSPDDNFSLEENGARLTGVCAPA
jgi:hypothetical protein